jgi:uncharacterized DUF497 family protein
MNFEWHEHKRQWVIDERGIDFLDVTQLFDGRDVITVRSPRQDEERWATTGLIGGKEITVIWTLRGENIRIISARRARNNERRAYHEVYG